MPTSPPIATNLRVSIAVEWGAQHNELHLIAIGCVQDARSLGDTMKVIVANKGRYRTDGTPSVSITPPSPLATRFKMSKALDRESMIARYASWLDEQLADPATPAAREFVRLRALLDTHGTLTLLCSCAPLACHGDVIRARLLGEQPRPPHLAPAARAARY